MTLERRVYKHESSIVCYKKGIFREQNHLLDIKNLMVEIKKKFNRLVGK